MMVLLMGKPVFRNYGDTLEIAELLPALFRKPFYDYKEWCGVTSEEVFTYLQGIVFY